MPYGILKADTLTYYTATGDVSIAISGLAISGSPLISGVSGIFTTSVSGATVTGDAGQFTTITGGTAQFTNITGVSGTFTSRISGATVTGTSGQFTTLTATTGVFTSVSGGTVSGDVGLFNTISGNQGVFNSSLSVPSGTAASPSISFNGDPNTGIYSSGADAVAISTNGTGRVFVNASGNLGVGVSNPSEKLQLADGNIYLGTGDRIVYNGGASGNLTFQTGTLGDLIFNTQAGSERLRITSAGLVGIGTSSPTARIQSEWNGGNQFRASNGSGTFDILNDSTNSLLISSGPMFYRTGTSGPHIFQYNNGSNEALRIDGSGRVGIGTTSPLAKLHLYENAATFIGTRSENSVASWINGVEGGGNYTIYSNNSANILFNNGGSERARIDTFGRLLVGTSSALTGASSQFSKVVALGNSANNGAGYFSIGAGSTRSNGEDVANLSFTDNGAGEYASIRAFADGATGSGDYPGRLVFSTTADGASSPTERVRISQNGVVTVKNGAVAEIGTLADGATVTPDFAANCNFTLTISGNRTLANPTNITAGQTGSIFIIQGTGSNALSWGSYWDFTGGTAPTLSTASGAVDRVDYVVRTSTSIHTVFTANYS